MEQGVAGTEGKATLRINITRGVVGALIAMLALVAALGPLVLGDEDAAASAAPAPVAAPQQTSTAPRRYYLTAYNRPGNDVTGVCTETFHVASIWELMDVSNLDYAVELAPGTALVGDDGGKGPPNGYVGWVRTGYSASTANTAGQANCDVWTSNSSAAYGTVAGLPIDWISEPNMSIWVVRTELCDTFVPVWCVQD